MHEYRRKNGPSISALLFGFFVAGTLSCPASGLAEAALSIPAPPINLPLLPSPASDWTVTIGLEGSMTPSFVGSKSYALSPKPIFSIQRAGSPEHFRGALDNSSIAIVDTGQFQLGVVGKLDSGRSSSQDKALRGLRNVGYAVQIGGFAQYFPVDWFRTRLEVREALGSYTGLVGDLSADIIVPLTQRITVSGGPRFSFASAQATAPFFDVNKAESLATALPFYHVKGSSYGAGVGGQLSYLLTSQWKAYGYVEYQRLLGSSASSPLVKLRGSPDQLTIGIGLSYAFDVSVR